MVSSSGVVGLAHARSARIPELRLFAAILDDAVLCLSPNAMVHPQTRTETLAWVRGEFDSVPACSFREICAVLELDETCVRARLLGA